MLNNGIVEPTATKTAARETTADVKASRSVLSRSATLVTGAVSSIALRLSVSGARSDRTGGDAYPGALTLLIHVRVQGFLLRAVRNHGVRGAAVDQGNVAEDA